MIDVEAVRSDTPSCEQFVHLDNCGSSPPPDQVIQTMIDHLRLEAEVGGYAAQDRRQADFEAVYDAGAQLLNCRADELACTSGASEAWWRAFTSVPLDRGDRILIGRTEYVANALALMQAADRGIDVDVVPDDEYGQLDVEALAGLLDERVRLVCVTAVAMGNGLVNPMAEIAKVVGPSPALLLVDACQAVGQLPVDVQEFNCDFLAFTGRKFVRGPRGTGMLYVRRSIIDQLQPPAFIDGRGAQWDGDETYRLEPTARRFELFERSYGAQLGLGQAISYANALGLESIDERIGQLAGRLRTGLDSIDGVRCLDTGLRRCGIVSFDVDGVPAGQISAGLKADGISASSPPIASSRFDMASRGVEEVARFGVHYFNTDHEIDRALEAVAGLAAGHQG
jgi:selenocysteine lyase/cysteine desulfurase